MLELQILTANVLLPVIVMLAGLAVIHWLPAAKTAQAPKNGEPTKSKSRLAQTLLLVCAVVAIWLAFGVRVGFERWPDDAWARLPQGFALVAIGSAVSSWLPTDKFLGKFTAALLYVATLIAAALAVFPTGEAWEFLTPTKYVWLSLLVAVPLICWWCAAFVTGTRATIMGFGWILCIAASAFLASDFLKVTEPLLAVASVVGCASLASWKRKEDRLLGLVAAPAIFAMGSAVASAQFNSYADVPDAMFWFAMAAPALAAIVICPVLLVAKDRAIGWKRTAITLGICLLFMAAVIAWKIMLTEASGSDEWS